MVRRSMMISTLACTVLAILALAGCSDPKAKVAGTYDLDKAAAKAAVEADIKAKGEDSEDAFALGMIAGMIDEMSISMTLGADGSAKLESVMMGTPDSVTGTWTLDGNTISITTESDEHSKETATGTVNGDIVTIKPPQSAGIPFDMVFKKRAG